MILDMLGADAGLMLRKDVNDKTVLYWAATYGAKDIAEVLLSNGAEVNAESSENIQRV